MKTANRFSARRPIPTLERQRGVVVIIVALCLVAMVGMAGLALDLGQLFVSKTELQNSADACALAAAQELKGAVATQLQKAEAAGLTVAGMHKVGFQDTDVGQNSSTITISFSPSNAAGSFVSGAGLGGPAALGMRYARCDVSKSAIKTFFIQVLNALPGVTIGDQTVSAMAVATLQPSQMTCALPVAICSTDLSGKAVGDWLQAAIGPPGGQGLTGNFKWVDFTPPSGGASELSNLITGEGACSLPVVGSEVGQPGNISSIAAAYNSRFGIYQSSVKPSDSAPDLSGYAYTDAAASWPSKKNAFPDFINRRTNSEPYQGNTLSGLNVNGTIQPSSYLKANGRDRRLMTAPVVDCGGFASGSTAPITSWACVFLLHPINNNAGGKGTGTGADRMFLEYRGSANDLSSPCASNGLPGDATSSGPLVTALVR
jgi:Flp pilus assembly protein TadG